VITRRTKMQLVVFVVITLLGVTYVGARYARLDRLFYDDSYTVVAHFPDSGGIYAGAEVSYRGVRVGAVDKMVLTEDGQGVDVHLSIENDNDTIPKDTLAVVGNRSALGEQYVDLQPLSDDKPYLEDESEIAQPNTRLPIATSTLLTDVSNTVSSVDRDALRTVVKEMGLAFDGTGEDLAQIIDTSNAFIETANENFDVTTALIRDSNVVLQGQLDSATAIRSFARSLSLFSSTLRGSDQDLRRLIDNGGATASLLREFLEKNQVEITDLLNNLVTIGELAVKYIDGTEMILVVYPYAVEGGFTVASKDPRTGLVDAHFGLVMTSEPPVCHKGYESTDRRSPQNTADRPMVMDAHCADPATTHRGAAHSPRAGAAYRPPVVATYDPETGKLVWNDDTDQGRAGLGPSTTVAPKSFGEESWKWLFLQPLALTQE
jgi:phospholipid/cholesterol/gamma-HCH transport system substrate-binding protein